MDRPHEFSRLASNRISELKRLSYSELSVLEGGTDKLSLDGRACSISVIVQRRNEFAFEVIVQGFLDTWFSAAKYCHVEGFIKYEDESVAEMEDSELYDYS